MIRIILPLVCAALGLAAASCSQSGDPFATAEAPAPSHPPLHGAASAATASPPATDPSSAATTPPAAAPEQMPPDQVPADQVPSLDETPPAATPQAASQSTGDSAADVPTATPAERRASTLIGMPVVATDGSPLGEVKDIVFDQQGRATHLVISYGTAPDASPGDGSDAGKPSPNPPTNPPTNLDGKLTAMPWDAAAASIRDGRVVLDGAKLRDAPSFTPQAWPNLDDPAWSGIADVYWRKAVRAAIAAHPGAPIDSTTRQRARRSRGDQ